MNHYKQKRELLKFLSDNLGNEYDLTGLDTYLELGLNESDYRKIILEVRSLDDSSINYYLGDDGQETVSATSRTKQYVNEGTLQNDLKDRHQNQLQTEARERIGLESKEAGIKSLKTNKTLQIIAIVIAILGILVTGYFGYVNYYLPQ